MATMLPTASSLQRGSLIHDRKIIYRKNANFSIYLLNVEVITMLYFVICRSKTYPIPPEFIDAFIGTCEYCGKLQQQGKVNVC